MAVEERGPGQANGFSNGFPGDASGPGFDNGIPGFAAFEGIQHLPDNDAGAFESRFAVANQRVGDDVFAE